MLVNETHKCRFCNINEQQVENDKFWNTMSFHTRPNKKKKKKKAVHVGAWLSLYQESLKHLCSFNDVPQTGITYRYSKLHNTNFKNLLTKLQGRDKSKHALISLPINSEELKWSGLVTDWASPCGLLFIHLKEKDCIETLKVGTS